MSKNATPARDRLFTIGWIMLLVAAGLMTLNHTVLAFVLDQPVLFTGFAAFNLYAVVVLAIPFRGREKWAWYATWILPIGLAIPAGSDPEIAAIYYVMALICLMGLALRWRAFWRPAGRSVEVIGQGA